MAKKNIKKQRKFREVKLEELQLSEDVKRHMPEIRHLEEDMEEEKRILMAREMSFLNEMLKEKKSKIKQPKKKKK